MGIAALYCFQSCSTPQRVWGPATWPLDDSSAGGGMTCVRHALVQAEDRSACILIAANQAVQAC